jgi:hypothetical protein
LASLNSLVARFWPLSAMRLVSSSVIIYYGSCLCTLAFLCEPLVCMIGCLGCVVSCGVVV